MKDEFTSLAVKTTPPTGIVLIDKIFGYTLQDWVYALTIVYLIVSIGISLYNFVDKKKKEAEEEEKERGKDNGDN